MAIEAIVKEAYAYLDSTPDDAVKMELATTLKDICSGKIYGLVVFLSGDWYFTVCTCSFEM